jgi:hypothetical protein
MLDNCASLTYHFSKQVEVLISRRPTKAQSGESLKGDGDYAMSRAAASDPQFELLITSCCTRS